MTEQPKRVLVVDDNPDMCEVLAEFLSGEGFDVYEAPDGHQGFTLALRVYPDAIISDELMPYMSGTELLVQIRADPLLSHTPFILLSSYYDVNKVSESLSRGANEYLPKPFNLDDLLVRLKRAMVPPPPSSRSVMRGDLRFFSLPDVLVMTHQNRQTGLLRVDDKDGAQRFQFLFDEGTLVWVSGPRDTLGVKAFNRSLRITEGGFKFTPWATFNRQPWHGHFNVNSLLLGGIQEVDELPLLLDAMPEGPLALSPTADLDALSPTGVAQPLIAGLIEAATAQELLDDHVEPDLELAKELKRLIDAGTLQVVG